MEQMTIVAMSDLHGHLPKISDLPSGDVLCICGDLVPLDIQGSFHKSLAWLCRKFFPWVEKLPHEYVIMVAGNHDFVFQELRKDKFLNHRKPKRVLSELLAPKKLHLLEDTGVVINGRMFWGSPWCELSNWAFYADSDEMIRKFNKIPEEVDVLLTHMAPLIADYGVSLDYIHRGRKDYGNWELAEAIRLKRPKVSIFGHIHSGDHHPHEYDGTTYCNVSLLNEQYKVAYKPTILQV